ncbi:hypothetical protein AB0J40_09305 [Amycolatopsis sp. NPDC049691]|uniref:hypothetical protein n=1 Tax=Amycolatopsis sp. NPDC049691 TaxID=3155155 RepID=UPI0034292D33
MLSRFLARVGENAHSITLISRPVAALAPGGATRSDRTLSRIKIADPGVFTLPALPVALAGNDL